MEVVFLVSGKRLAVLQEECEGKSVMAVKQSLATYVGVSRFRQRLFVEDGSREMQDDEIIGITPAKVQLVILEFCPPDTEQSQQMFTACANSDVVALEKLLQCALQPNVTNEDGATPLHMAACTGHVASVQLLLEAGANIDHRDSIGALPIFVADACGHLDVVRCLAERWCQQRLGNK